jgi:hypothetical protein
MGQTLYVTEGVCPPGFVTLGVVNFDVHGARPIVVGSDAAKGDAPLSI